MYKTLAMTAAVIALSLAMPAYADEAEEGIIEEETTATGDEAMTDEGGGMTDENLLDEDTAEAGVEADVEAGAEGELDNPAIGEDQPGVITGEDVEDDEPGAGRGSTE